MKKKIKSNFKREIPDPEKMFYENLHCVGLSTPIQIRIGKAQHTVQVSNSFEISGGLSEAIEFYALDAVKKLCCQMRSFKLEEYKPEDL